MSRLAALFIALAGTADAGAWPREKGTGFLSTSIEVAGFQNAQEYSDVDHFSSTYMEYGLTNSLTLGLNAGESAAGNLDGRLFLRMPVKVPVLSSDTHKFAVELSLGASTPNIYIGPDAYLGLGLQYGRGFSVFDRHGWLSVESRIDFVAANGGNISYRQSKLDLTVGLNHTNRLKSMAQLFLTETNGDLYATFSPSLVLPIGERNHLQSGVTFDLGQGTEWGINIGLWRDF